MGVPASKKIAVASGVAFLEPKFAQEHDARASFGHRARVRAHASIKIGARIQSEFRIQIMHA